MTSVPFDLQVTVLNDRGKNEHYETVEFRFTTKSARALERAAQSGIQWLVARGQSVEALVLLVCYGLQWQYPKMTEAKAVDLIDAFVERGGDVTELSKTAFKALNESGIYGKPERDDDRPTRTTPEATTETPQTP